jgi:hypothetical protein
MKKIPFYGMRNLSVIILSAIYVCANALHFSNRYGDYIYMALLLAILLIGNVQYVFYCMLAVIPTGLNSLPSKVVIIIIPLAVIYDTYRKRSCISVNPVIPLALISIITIETLHISVYSNVDIMNNLYLLSIALFCIHIILTTIDYSPINALLFYLSGLMLSIVQIDFSNMYNYDFISFERLSGYVLNANSVALSIAFALALIISAMFQYKRLEIVGGVLFFALAIIGFMTVSKTYIVAIVLMALVLIVKTRKIRAKIIVSVMFMSMLSLYFFYSKILLIIDKIFNYYIYRITGYAMLSADVITTGRTYIYDEYIHKLFSNYLYACFGCGIQIYPRVLAINQDTSSHNVILEIISSWGVSGLILVIILVIALLSSIRNSGHSEHQEKNDPNKYVYYLPFIIILIWSLSSHMLFSYSIYFLFAIAALNISVKRRTVL